MSLNAFWLCHGYLWLQNDLEGQAIVVDRIDYTYEVPGARLSIPSFSAPVGFRINPIIDPSQCIPDQRTQEKSSVRIRKIRSGKSTFFSDISLAKLFLLTSFLFYARISRLYHNCRTS